MLNHIKTTVDGISVSSIAASFIGLITLPNLVYLATFIWTVLRIYEMKTVQKLLSGRKNKKLPL